MKTFAPILSDSLKGFYKYFIYLIMNQGVKGLGITQAGKKG